VDAECVGHRGRRAPDHADRIARHLPIVRHTSFQGSAVERMWHIYDSQGQILALSLRYKSSFSFKIFLLRSTAAGETGEVWPRLSKLIWDRRKCILVELLCLTTQRATKGHYGQI